MTYWLTEADTLLAAKQFIEQGRDEEAEVQLKKALAFYRSVGATCFVGEAEALLSAASRGTRYRIGTDLNYR